MFSFLDMKDANTLKLVCKQLREDVRNAFWSVHTDKMALDKRQNITNLRKWRDAYPNARPPFRSRLSSPARTTCTSKAFATCT